MKQSILNKLQQQSRRRYIVPELIQKKVMPNFTNRRKVIYNPEKFMQFAKKKPGVETPG